VVQYSEDLKTWGPPNPAVWSTVIHSDKIEVKSQSATINPKGFFRVKATLSGS
jgi:hypothetical protein